MASYIAEEDVENLALQRLGEAGYKVYKSDSYTGPDKEIDALRDNDHSQVILKPLLKKALKKINPGYEEKVYDNCIRQFERLADSSDMMINNHQLHKLIIGGAKVKTTVNGEDRTLTLYSIDFENVDSNKFIATNQYTVDQGDNEIRTDITLFINGLPLVTFELKDLDNQNVGIQQAYSQLSTYKSILPNYMQYNEILITSDGANARAGTLTAGIDRFMRWREPKNAEVDDSDMELEILIKYMLNPKTLLNLIQNFIIFETDGDETIKILAAYHQYYMVNKALKRTKKILKDPNDKRIGVVWHTTGSGKSLSMVFYTGIVSRKLGNPSFLVINDRDDLDDQLFDTFASADEYLQQKPKHSETREDVRNYMNRNSGGIVFSTIQKFSPNFDAGEEQMPILTDRSDVIVIADEAHRTQYGMQAKLTSNGIRYGYAKYLRDALPNASFIGFTGTPINKADKSTVAVFGNYIDVYDITQAVNDHATVRIYYESHVFPLKLKESAREDYQKLVEEAGIDDNPNLPENERRNRAYTRLEALAGAKPRLEKIAQHFVKHFESRQKEEFGKSMIVEVSRKNAIKLYKEIIKLRPDWASDDIHKGKIKVIMTSSASDGPEFEKFKTTKRERVILQNRMKDDFDELQIVIVVDMWLTGFDVPSLNTMYIDKPMKGHNLIQAIARVNRVFKNKDSGLIIDYVGIADALKFALSIYSKDDQGQVGINVDRALMFLKEKYDIIKNDFLYGINYSGFDSKDAIKRQKTVARASNELLAESDEMQQRFYDTVTEAQKAFALVSTHPEAQELASEIAFFKAVKVFITKVKSTGGIGDGEEGGKRAVDYRMQQLLDQSIISEPEVDIYKDLGLERPNLDLISDDFLNKIQKIEEKDTAVAILEKLLKGKIHSYQKRNLVKGQKFEDMLKKSIDEYNKRGINSEIVIRNLITLAKEINAEQAKGKDLGLSPEEIAFYDALADHEKAVKELGEEKLHLIAAELVKTVKAQSGVDWERRRSVRAKMRVAVKKLLRKYGYPPDISSQAVDTVVSQAEQIAATKSKDSNYIE